ncbi:MAG: type II secretion system GspH family protein [Planctomycetes bacterium]|nr:type II secretion system GspH family protein [Planctomycetota bacterium]
MRTISSPDWPTAATRHPALPAAGCPRQPTAPRAFTLVEMLVAMAITLVMMAAVVTLFANVSNSVRNRRATIEMTNQLRQVRNVLQQDLQGATSPGITWQRPDSNHGYIELIEGPSNDQDPTPLVRDADRDGVLEPSEIQLDPALSPIPRNNIGVDGADGTAPDGKISTQELEAHYQDPRSLVPGALGDYDDILMLTVRNEHEPFVGRAPTDVRDDTSAIEFNVSDSIPGWDYDTIESPLAEVVWFCVENPPGGQNPNKFFGEPGMRTIYRRALLIAPWVNPYSLLDASGRERPFDGFKAEPGLVRLLPSSVGMNAVEDAIAAIIAFQDQYDLSVRLEWDHNIERWKIMANTLADLTKRENRFGHFGFLPSNPSQRIYPYPIVSIGRGYSGNGGVTFVTDPEVGGSNNARWEAVLAATGGAVISYALQNANNLGAGYDVRPFAYVDDEPNGVPATAQAMLNDEGQVVRVVHGPVPLWGARRGQDVMMTGVLGFDMRVYDPGAPLYGRRDVPNDINSPLTVLQPSDPGWKLAYNSPVGSVQPNFEFVGQGAYIDMGYAFNATLPTLATGTSWTLPWFAEARSLIDIYYDSRPPGVGKVPSQLAPGYSVYDTWSFHYENNGVNEDGDGAIDEAVNGFDDIDPRVNAPVDSVDAGDAAINGPDDVGERETVPPYDKPLRGVQVLIRTYEPDSRAIRQVRVNQHFMPE